MPRSDQLSIRVDSVTPAHWRQWAALSILAWGSGTTFRTKDVLHRMERSGWEHLLPQHGRSDAVHRALKALEKRGHVQRLANHRPTRWVASELGLDFASEFLFDNPNVTPEASRAEI